MKFITIDAESVAGKRKHAGHACERCRRSKRRCNHSSDLNSQDGVNDIELLASARRDEGHGNENKITSQHHPNLSNISGVSRPQDSRPRSRYVIREQHDVAQDDTEKSQDSTFLSSRRFIGESNPESVFRSVVSPEMTTREQSSQNSIGIWLADSVTLEEQRQSQNHNVEQGGIFFNPSPATQKMLSSLLETECFSVLPPKPFLSRLLSFFVEEIHPLLPMVNLNFFQKDIDRRSKILLSQAMCLLASMCPQCEKLLHLPDGNEPLPPRLFGRHIFSAMRVAIELGAVTNKMVLIQALGMMSLFSEGPEGPETASQLCAKMIQLVYTLGLHLQGVSGHDDGHEITCLCCVWALDRLNAAIHGRAVLMHERDIGRNLQKSFESQKPTLRLLLAVISHLDQVIDLYRPQSTRQDTEITINYPQFDDLVVFSQGTTLHAKLLTTIEILYHAVAILSCRGSDKGSTIQVRQIYAASKINSILELDRKSNDRSLILLPFVPYAASLSLSIHYKQVRSAKIAMYRKRAVDDLQSTCVILDELGAHFYVASTMASMGKATVAEMERISEAILRERSSDNRTDFSQPPTEISHSRDEPATNLSVCGTTGDARLLNFDETLASSNSTFTDFDVFELFDPNFGLEDIDAVFQSNLDLSMPLYLPSYP